MNNRYWLIGLLLVTTSAPTITSASPDPDAGLLLTDFTTESTDLGWYVVNDNVMGGRSDGEFEQKDGVLNFTGRTNTNGGGFSSIRTNPLELALADHSGIQLRVNGEGRRYMWRLTTNARWRGRPVGYWAEFPTQDGVWTTVNLPWSNFRPQYRGYRLDGPALDPGQITGMGLMIYDGLDGPFALQLASVGAYSASPPARE